MARLPAAALTALQFNIMQAVWDRPEGATMTEIRSALAGERDIGRTTVLNLVARLTRRRWLKREKRDGVFRYAATTDRETATADAAVKFVDDFFGGSAKELIVSLIGTKRLSRAELESLRRLVRGEGDKS
jgi:BlaI family penicillinase repressor